MKSIRPTSVVVACFLGSLFFACASSPAGATVTPIVEYVTATGPTTYSVHWGYNNTSASSVTIPKSIQAGNYFTPGPQSYSGQPITFLAGRQVDVFQTTIDTTTSSFNSVSGWSLSWRLNGNIATATASSPAQPQSAFHYQGVLRQSNGAPVSGARDLTFTLWNSVTSGLQVGQTVTVPGVVVTNGLFAADVDFGAAAYTSGNPLWVETSVRSGAGMGDYETLSPRQPLSVAPFSAFSYQTRGVSVDAAQNVGIGTTAPAARLHVASTVGNASVRVDSPSASSALELADSGTVDWSVGKDSGNEFYVAEPGHGNWLTVQPNSLDANVNGDLGIGTAPGSGRFRVSAGTVTSEQVDQQSLGITGYYESSTDITQTFTPAVSGFLTAITVNGTGSNNVINVTDSTGALIASQPWSAPNSYATDFTITFTKPATVVAGQTYTWSMYWAPGAGVTGGGTQNLAYADPGGYAGGRANVSSTADFYFKTYVAVPGPTGDAVYVDALRGSVGIGTATPAAMLEVNGTAKLKGLQLSTATAAGDILTSDASGNATWQAVPNPYSGTINVVGGNVGIGTAAPSNRLSVSGNADFSGNVGIGTSSPAAALEVHGDVKLGSSGQYSAAGADNPVRFLAGDISGSSLAINNGGGFTVARNGRTAGGYHITFTTPFATAPVVTATANAEADGLSATFSNPTTGGVDVLLTTSNNGFRDARFSFIAIGGR